MRKECVQFPKTELELKSALDELTDPNLLVYVIKQCGPQSKQFFSVTSNDAIA